MGNPRVTTEASMAENTAGEWFPIDTAPQARIGSGSWQNHGPRILVASGEYVQIAQWAWHANKKTGNWKSEYGRVIMPDAWRSLPIRSPAVILPTETPMPNADLTKGES